VQIKKAAVVGQHLRRFYIKAYPGFTVGIMQNKKLMHGLKKRVPFFGVRVLLVRRIWGSNNKNRQRERTVPSHTLLTIA
jgi:hypothetical protein